MNRTLIVSLLKEYLEYECLELHNRYSLDVANIEFVKRKGNKNDFIVYFKFKNFEKTLIPVKFRIEKHGKLSEASLLDYFDYLNFYMYAGGEWCDFYQNDAESLAEFIHILLEQFIGNQKL